MFAVKKDGPYFEKDRDASFPLNSTPYDTSGDFGHCQNSRAQKLLLKAFDLNFSLYFSQTHNFG